MAITQNTVPQRRRLNMRAKKGKRKDVHIANVVRSVLSQHIERKVFSITAVGTSVSTSGTVIPVTNGIVEGDDINGRTGTAIKLVKFRILYRGTASSTSASLRFILFRDMLNQGSTPSVVNLLPNGNWISQYADTREIQQHRFTVLNDIMMDLNVAGDNVLTRQQELPFKGTVFYNGANAVSTDNGPGAVFLLVIGNSILTSYDYTIQVVYTDA